MNMLARYTPGACRAIAYAGARAMRTGLPRLPSDALLAGLVAVPDASPVLARLDLPLDELTGAVAPQTGARGWSEQDVLAAIGIDVDEVRRHLGAPATGTDDQRRLWELRRDPLRPLRLVLRGPGVTTTLTAHSRKIVEVAAWAAGRSRPVTGDHLLWGILADTRNAASLLLTRQHVNQAQLWDDLHASTVAAA